MPITLLLLSYGVITTSFLTIVYVRSEYYKHLYQNVLWDSYSLERIRLFFQKIKPLLKLMYPIVDKLNKRRGRPATNRRFQLRFIIWWKFFALLMVFYGFFANFWFIVIKFFIYFGASQEVYSARISSILKPLRVGDLMLGPENVLTVSPDMPLSQALDLMFQAQVQDLIICSESKYLGIITWDELLKIPRERRLITRVGDLQIKPLSIMSENSVFDAYKVMVKERTRLVPVINTDVPCYLMGVITNQSIAYNIETAKFWGS